MIIGIDIDDTLTNSKEIEKDLWIEYVKKYPKEGYNGNLPSDINTFGIKYIEKFWDIYREPISFKSTYKKDCSKVLHKLKDEGYTLCVITSRPENKYYNLINRQKQSFIDNDIPIDILFTDIREKAKFCKKNNIDLLIDDSINHIEECNKLGIKTILFNDIPEYKGIQTDNWNELYNIIKEYNK